MPVSPAQVASVELPADWVAVCAEVSEVALEAVSVEDMLEVVAVPGGTSPTKTSTPTTLAQIKALQPPLLVQG